MRRQVVYFQSLRFVRESWKKEEMHWKEETRPAPSRSCLFGARSLPRSSSERRKHQFRFYIWLRTRPFSSNISSAEKKTHFSVLCERMWENKRRPQNLSRLSCILAAFQCSWRQCCFQDGQDKSPYGEEKSTFNLWPRTRSEAKEKDRASDCRSLQLPKERCAKIGAHAEA